MEKVMHITEVDKNDLAGIIREAVREELMSMKDTGGSHNVKRIQWIKGTKQLAEYLGLGISKTQKLIAKGIFERFQDARTVLYDPEKVDQAITNYYKNAPKPWKRLP